MGEPLGGDLIARAAQKWPGELGKVAQFPAKGFIDLDEARAWAAGFVRWYKHDHRHSGIHHVSPPSATPAKVTDAHAGRSRRGRSPSVPLVFNVRTRRKRGPTWRGRWPERVQSRPTTERPAMERQAARVQAIRPDREVMTRQRLRVRTRWCTALEREVVSEAGDFLFIPPCMPHTAENLRPRRRRAPWWHATTRRSRIG